MREFELLVAMAQRSGAIVTREELYRTVWGGELRPGDRSVDVYVSKLRGKLEAALPDRRFIHTHPGFGYRFQPQPSRRQWLARDRCPRATDADDRAARAGFHEIFTSRVRRLETPTGAADGTRDSREPASHQRAIQPEET